MKSVKRSLNQLGLKPSKQRGQNFCVDESVIANIVEFGKPQPGENLLEIGPGLGALTEALSRYGRLTLIEIEPKFCRELSRRFPQARVMQADVREVSLAAFGPDLVVFGNLPYAFSSDIIFHLIDNAAYVRRAVLLLQREFAERLAAEPGGRAYGVLSISAQLWAKINLGPIVAGDAFHPPAKVESRLVELIFSGEPRYEVADPVGLHIVVRAAFSRRRKKLLNSLEGAGLFSREKISRALEKLAIDPARRAETLSIQEYVYLARELNQK